MGAPELLQRNLRINIPTLLGTFLDDTRVARPSPFAETKGWEHIARRFIAGIVKRVRTVKFQITTDDRGVEGGVANHRNGGGACRVDETKHCAENGAG